MFHTSHPFQITLSQSIFHYCNLISKSQGLGQKKNVEIQKEGLGGFILLQRYLRCDIQK